MSVAQEPGGSPPPVALDGGLLWQLLPLGMCLVDEALRVHAWNRQLEAWTNLPAEQTIGRTLPELFPEWPRSRFETRIAQVLETGVPIVLSAALHRHFLPLKSATFPDDGYMHQETRVQRLSVDPPRVLIAIDDLTGAVHQQKLLRRDREQLLEARQTIEAANASLQATLTQVNDQNEKLQAEVRERRRAEADLRRQTNEFIESKKREASHLQHLEQLVRDLTVARQQAEAAARAKSEFLANMSHEIRTPMTAILGYVDLLQDPELSREERANATASIHRNGGHLLEIINDILDLSKIEAGKMILETMPVGIHDLLRDVDNMMRGRAKEQGLGLDIRAVEPLPRKFLCDPTRLRQILVNLVSNAIKFTAEGHVLVLVKWIDPLSPRGRLSIAVSDTGIGMSQETIQRLFRPFIQGDSRMNREFGGTGLGLVISQRLAKMLGGEIHVASELGRGSTFTLDLPCAEIASPVTPSTNSAPGTDVMTPDKPLQGARLLIVDDAPDNRKLLSFHLKKAGAEFELAENGQEALDKIAAAREVPFDVILMDMQMPILDGYAATSQLRAGGNDTPVIAVTAHALDGDREKCLAAGCSDYLTKPIQKEQLVATTFNWLQRALALQPR